MEMVHIIQVVVVTKVNGSMIWDKVMEDKYLMMAQDSKEITKKIERMGKVSFIGQMAINILDSLNTIEGTAKALWSLRMEDNIKATGLMIKCMGMDFLLGLMASPIKDTIFRIRSREKEGLVMVMAPIIKEIGIRASSMVGASLGIEMENIIKELMRTANQNNESLK